MSQGFNFREGFVDSPDRLRMARGIDRLTHAEIYEDFFGKAAAALTRPWVATKTGTSTNNSTDFVTSSSTGIYRLTHSSDSEAQTMRIDWNDALHINMSKGPIFRARVKLNLAGATMSADQRVVIGLASAYNATLDDVATNAWFRLEGANLNIYCETDDATTDSDDQDTTVDYVDDTYQIFEIDATSLSAVRFTVYPSTGPTPTASKVLSMADITANTLVQPIIAIQRDAGTEVETLDIDWVQVVVQR